MQLSSIDFRTFNHVVSKLAILSEILDKNINVYYDGETTFSLPLKKGSLKVNLGLKSGSVDYFNSQNLLVEKIEFSYAGHYQKCFDTAFQQAIAMDGNRYNPNIAALADIEGHHKITLISKDGELAQTFQLPHNNTILWGTDSQNIEVPFNCSEGKCGTCVSRVISGNVEQSEQQFLNEYQQMTGYILLCCSTAKSDCVIETHQEAVSRN
jgi:ferredoxin